MATRRSPWMTKVYELLADGNWHDLEQLLEAAMPLVPPGVARRQAVHARDKWRENHGHTGPRVHPALSRPQDPVRVGARRKVMDSISSAKQRGQIEQRGSGSGRQLRLTPRNGD
jgi:hypothetical protein